MDKHLLVRNLLYQAQTCSEGTWDEALEWIKTNNPSGTALNWKKHEGEDFKPTQCKDCPERTHFMFSC